MNLGARRMGVCCVQEDVRLGNHGRSDSVGPRMHAKKFALNEKSSKGSDPHAQI